MNNTGTSHSTNRGGNVCHLDFAHGKPIYIDLSTVHATRFITLRHTQSQVISPTMQAQRQSVARLKFARQNDDIRFCSAPLYSLVVESLGIGCAQSMKTLKIRARKCSVINN